MQRATTTVQKMRTINRHQLVLKQNKAGRLNASNVAEFYDSKSKPQRRPPELICITFLFQATNAAKTAAAEASLRTYLYKFRTYNTCTHHMALLQLCS